MMDMVAGCKMAESGFPLDQSACRIEVGSMLAVFLKSGEKRGGALWQYTDPVQHSFRLVDGAAIARYWYWYCICVVAVAGAGVAF
jgi:hypothetical protein